MREVIVFAEGPSDEQFIKRVVAPALRHLQIFLKPQTLNTSKDAKGGAVSYDRLKFNARNTLRQYPNAVLSTFLDLYGLDTDFPAFQASKQKTNVYQRTETLELALHEAIVEHVGCRPERFIPHIQPYEFEGLLFSDPSALSSTEPAWQAYQPKLAAIKAGFETPEHINDSYETKPASRLEKLLQPTYKKTRHGPLAAEKVTLATMEQECLHFREWLAKLRGLAGN